MTHGHFLGWLRFSFAELKKPAIYIFSEIYIYYAFQRYIICRIVIWNGAHTNFFPEDTREGPE